MRKVNFNRTLICLLLCTNAATVSGDFLNEYFDDKTFGRSPGPCPDENNKCFIDLDPSTFPEALSEIEVCLFEFAFVDICDTIGNWVRGGQAEIWNVQCEAIGVNDLSLERQPSDLINENTLFSADGIRQKCTGDFYLYNLVLQTDIPLVLKLNPLLIGADHFVIGFNGGGLFFTNGDGRGVDLEFRIEFDAAPPEGFEKNIPNFIKIPERSCEISASGFGLSIQLPNNRFEDLNIGADNGLVIDISLIAVDSFLNLLIIIIEVFFADIICQVIVQSAVLDNGDPGFLNVLLNEAAAFLDEYSNGTALDIFSEHERLLNNDYPGMTAAKLSDSINFKTSTIFDVFSSIINDWLGSDTNNDGSLAINDAIDLLFGENGAFVLDFEKAGLDLAATLPIYITNATVSLLEIQAQDLNTITEFGIALNDFSGIELEHALNHFFRIDTVSFSVDVSLLLNRGEWVTKSSCSISDQANSFSPTCTSDQEELKFRFILKVSDFKLAASTLLAVNPSELNETLIGQIFGRDLSTDILQSLDESLRCAAPAIYAFKFTSLSSILADIVDVDVPTDLVSDQELFELINEFIDLSVTLTESIYTERLEGITEGPVKDAINEFLLNYVTNYQGPDVCLPYVQTPSVYPYLNYTSLVAKSFFAVVNSVLGNPKAGTTADINDLVQVLLEFASLEFDIFPFEPDTSQGQGFWKTKNVDLVTLRAFKGATFPNSGIALMKIYDGRLDNVNSITVLSANPVSAEGFNITLSFDTDVENALALRYHFSAIVDDYDLDEVVEIVMKVVGLQFSVGFEKLLVNSDEILRLTFGQLAHIPCLISVIDDLTIIENPSLSISSLDVDLNRLKISDGSSSGLPNAIESLSTELSSPTPQFDAMVNTILENTWSEFWKLVETSLAENQPQNPESCDDVQYDLLSFISGISLPNLTALVEGCIEEPDPPNGLTPEEAEARILNINIKNDNYINFTEVGMIIDTFAQISFGGVGLQLLQVLANATGNPISDLLTLEDDNSVSLDIALNEPNFIFDFFGISGLSFNDDRIIPGLNVQGERFKVRGLEKILDDIDFLNPLSTFVTRNHFGFGPGNPLIVEITGFFEANASFIGGNPSDKVREDISFAFSLEDFQLDMDILLAIDVDLFLNLSIGHIFNVTENQDILFNNDAASCLLSIFYEKGFYISFLSIAVNDVPNIALTTTENNILSDAFLQVVNEVIILVTRFYIEALPNICQNCVRTFLNDLFENAWELEHTNTDNFGCPAEPTITPLSAKQQVFRFSTAGAISSLQNFLDTILFVDDYALWNTIMLGLTSTVLFTDTQIGTDIPFIYQGIDYGSLSIYFDHLQIKNLDTFEYVDFLRPKQILNPARADDSDFNTISGYNISGPLDLKFNLDIRVYDFFPDFPEYVNVVTLEVTLSVLMVLLELFLKVDIYQTLSMQFSSFSAIPCLLVPVDEMAFREFVFKLDGLDLSLTCQDRCDAPSLNALQGATATYENGDDIIILINDLIEYLNEYMTSDTFQSALDKLIASAEVDCEQFFCLRDGSCRTKSLGDDEVFKVLSSVFGAGFLGFACLVWFIIPIHKRRRETALSSISSGGESEVFKSKHDLKREDQLIVLQHDMYSLFAHPRPHLVTKFLIPLLCIINVACLVLAIGFSDAIHLNSYFTILGVKSREVTLVNLSMIQLIDDIWNSDSYGLALLLAVASCAWPIVKNISLFTIWFLPTTILSSRRRYTILQALDYLGKWSLLEALIITVSMAGVSTAVDISEQSIFAFLGPGFFLLEVNLTVERGITLLLYVAVSSLLMNHAMSSVHHKNERYNREVEDKLRHTITKPPRAALERRNLCGYRFSNLGTTKVGIDKRAVRLVTLVSIVAFLLVLVGTTLPVVTFVIKGVVGLALTVFDDGSSRSFSVIDLGAQVGEGTQRDFGQVLATSFFQAVFYTTCVVAPLLQAPFNMALLYMRLTLRDMKLLQWICQIISYWAAIECLIVGLLGLVLEAQVIITYIANLVTNDICANIEWLLVALLGEENGTCIVLEPVLEPSVIVLIIGVFLSTCCTLVIVTMSSAAAGDRYWKAYKDLRHDAEPEKPGILRRNILKLVTCQIKTKANITPAKKEHDSIQNPVYSGSLTFSSQSINTRAPQPPPIVFNDSQPHYFPDDLSVPGNLRKSVKPRKNSEDSLEV